jgi:hypothetical protein
MKYTPNDPDVLGSCSKDNRDKISDRDDSPGKELAPQALVWPDPEKPY